MCEKWKVTRKTKQRKAQDDDDNCPPFLFLCYAVFVFPVSPLFASLVDTFIPSSVPSCYGLFFFFASAFRILFFRCCVLFFFPVLPMCVGIILCLVFFFLLLFCSSFLRFFVCTFLPFVSSQELMFLPPPPLFHLFSVSSVSSYLPFVFCGMF